MEIDRSANGQIEQPSRRSRSALDGDVRPQPRERVDDFDVTRRVAEAVAGSVEGDRWNTDYRIQNSEYRMQKDDAESGNADVEGCSTEVYILYSIF
jgi:hypothetical protein